MEFTITKERVLKMAEECPEVKSVLKRGFPEAFEPEWKDITEDIKWSVERSRSGLGMVLRGRYLGSKIVFCGRNGIKSYLSYANQVDISLEGDAHHIKIKT